MSKQKILKSLIISALSFSATYANEVNFIEIGGGFVEKTDNFVAGDDFSPTDKSSSKAVPNLQFAYHIPMNDKFTIYAKSQYGELNLGSFYKINNSSKINFGLMIDLMAQEQWQDPFNKTTNSDKTDVSKAGAFISYSMPINADLYSTIQYKSIKNTYDKDEVLSDLQREGTENILSLMNVYWGTLINLNYKVYNADGDASSYSAYEIEAGRKLELTEKLSLLVLVNAGKLEYDERNPVFDKVIDATTYGLKTQIKYQEPFNYKNTYISLSAGFDKEDANDEFYDKKNTYGMASIGYKF